MDPTSVFLICFAVALSSLLIAGWRFGYPLLVHYAGRRSALPLPLPMHNPQNGSEAVQSRQETARCRGESSASISNSQPNHSLRSSPANSFFSTGSRMESSCYSRKATDLDISIEKHDLKNMAAVPAVPKQGLNRPITGIGTQAPPAALLAKRSRDTLKSRRSARTLQSAMSGSSSYYGDVDHRRVFASTSQVVSRTRTSSDATTPSPLRQNYYSEFSADHIPPIPTYLTMATRSNGGRKTSLSNPTHALPVLIRENEDRVTGSAPKIEKVDAEQVEINAGNIELKTLSKTESTRSESYYEVQSLFPPSPSLRKPLPAKMNLFETPSSRSTPKSKTPSPGSSFTNSIKRFTRRAQATPTDEEASPSTKLDISGPSRCVPRIGSGWSPDEYLLLHRAKTIENPLIEHAAVGSRQFVKEEDHQATDEDVDTSMIVRHKMRQLDSHYDYKSPHKVHCVRSPRATS